MTKRSVQLFFAITATGDALASITVPHDSRLTRVVWSITPTAAAGSGAQYVQTEASVNSARQVTNDATGIISVASAHYNELTSGGGSANTEFSHDCDIPFKAGDKIYLHAVESGAVTWSTRCLMHFE